MKTLKQYDEEIKAIKNGILKKVDEEVYELNNQFLPLMKAEVLKNPIQFIDEFFAYMSLYIEDNLRRFPGYSSFSSDEEIKTIAEKIHEKDRKDFRKNNDYLELIMAMNNKYSPSFLTDKFYKEVFEKTAYLEDYEAILKLQKESEALREYEARKAQLQKTTSKLPI